MIRLRKIKNKANWNAVVSKWSIEKRKERLRLSGADLSGADLSGAYLRDAYLSFVNLSGANLSGADLSGADLYDANLSGADLSGADLSGATLDFTNWLSMSCLSFDIKIDKDNFYQLLYHICKLDVDHLDVKHVQEYLKSFANKASVIQRHKLEKLENINEVK